MIMFYNTSMEVTTVIDILADVEVEKLWSG